MLQMIVSLFVCKFWWCKSNSTTINDFFIFGNNNKSTNYLFLYLYLPIFSIVNSYVIYSYSIYIQALKNEKSDLPFHYNINQRKNIFLIYKYNQKLTNLMQLQYQSIWKVIHIKEKW